ncbi:hypothetical protein L486_08406 [Kwoniella mangroviensis CBS 10435]|uniref:Uncharacterized protein n=1 Tax=Kwoniella mangroviensis CBS 10435 TaxID=1331196 RepID=A0A1B9IEV9_9TREE|nr:uncharacterized protein I203_00682 [Kwoniella mangroviensis CBS 8507]OCF54083.1 hypothetical protein L486_08406 [Kwoniella mangroviensis CBS 10435]OCF70547.1 hypothetical protein I203_00682 [Kwoniella mangroviensis CBS 8507]OCF76326.1 hypothetical protein I204_03626 [Kwoniella mangroviensis CBS 8886]
MFRPTILNRSIRLSLSSRNQVRTYADKKMTDKAAETFKEAGQAFKSDGAIGSNFNADGAIGSKAQQVGGPFSADGAIGKQFTDEGAIGGTGQKAAEQVEEAGKEGEKKV